MPDHEFLVEVLSIFSKADSCDTLFWRTRADGGLELYANVSDIFSWGLADAEDITPERLPVLRRAFEDLKAVDDTGWLAELYTARVRDVRPQGAGYPTKAATQELFNACGPEREIGFGNPRPIRPADVLHPDKGVSVRPHSFRVSLLPEDDINYRAYVVTVENRGEDRWAITRDECCLGYDGQWDPGVKPYGRGDEWLESHRFTLDMALEMAKEAVRHVEVNGRPISDVLAGKPVGGGV